MNRTAISFLSLVFMLSVFVFYGCTTVPRQPTTDIKLNETHILTGFGFSFDYPAGWIVKTLGPATIISELRKDQRPVLTGRVPLNGYQIVMDHRGLPFMQRRSFGLPEDPSLDDLPEINIRFFGWEELEVSETVAFGMPTFRVKTRDRRDNWVNAIMGFREDEAFILWIAAPSEEQLGNIMPIWNKILESSKPA